MAGGNPTGCPRRLRKPQGALSEDEAKTIAAALANRQPWREWTGKREKVDPAPPSKSPQDCWID